MSAQFASRRVSHAGRSSPKPSYKEAFSASFGTSPLLAIPRGNAPAPEPVAGMRAPPPPSRVPGYLRPTVSSSARNQEIRKAALQRGTKTPAVKAVPRSTPTSLAAATAPTHTAHAGATRAPRRSAVSPSPARPTPPTPLREGDALRGRSVSTAVVLDGRVVPPLPMQVFLHPGDRLGRPVKGKPNIYAF